MSNDEQAAASVEIAPVERQRFSDAHACTGEQAEQRGVRGSDERQPQGPGRIQQSLHIVRRVQVGSPSRSSARKKAGARDLGPWIEGLSVLCERSHQIEARRVPRRSPPSSLGRPGQRKLGADEGGAAPLEKVDEAGEQTAGPLQLVTECAANADVLAESLPEVDHTRCPGQGRAIIRKRAVSTFA